MKNVPEEISSQQTSLYFLIKINNRQCTSLQGEIEWLNQPEKKIRYFRNFLELMSLISDALELAGDPEADYNLTGWQDLDSS